MTLDGVPVACIKLIIELKLVALRSSTTRVEAEWHQGPSRTTNWHTASSTNRLLIDMGMGKP